MAVEAKLIQKSKLQIQLNYSIEQYKFLQLREA
jgi:hypothetical protein